MKINFFLFSSFLILSLCMESDFEILYSNWNESKIVSSLRKTFVKVDASFGSNMEKFELALDVDCQATVIPGVETKETGDFKKFDISKTSTFEMKKNFSFYSGEKFVSGIYGKDSFK